MRPGAGPALAGALASLCLTVWGCARTPLIAPVQVTAAPVSVPAPYVTDYRSAVALISNIMVTELRLPLPGEVVVFVYPTREAYAEGLARHGRMSRARAAEIAAYSVGLGQPRRLFISDAGLRGKSRGVWLGVVAHELTHVAQYELSGGRRGRSEQWLREGMADWVAARVLERLGETTFGRRRNQALKAVARSLHPVDREPPDLARLGTPRGWETWNLYRPEAPSYRLAFLLTDLLIQQHGMDRMIAYFRAFARSNDRFGAFQDAFGVVLGDFAGEAVRRLAAETPPPQARSGCAPGGPTEASAGELGPGPKPACAGDEE